MPLVLTGKHENGNFFMHCAPWTYFQMDTAAVGDALTRLNVFFRKNIHDRQLRVWDEFSTFLCKIKHCLISMGEGWGGLLFRTFLQLPHLS